MLVIVSYCSEGVKCMTLPYLNLNFFKLLRIYYLTCFVKGHSADFPILSYGDGKCSFKGFPTYLNVHKKH